jgi:hypothetical protein
MKSAPFLPQPGLNQIEQEIDVTGIPVPGKTS